MRCLTEICMPVQTGRYTRSGKGEPGIEAEINVVKDIIHFCRISHAVLDADNDGVVVGGNGEFLSVIERENG